MAYVTGSANSLADLLTAIQSACTANGWTLAGNVLSKGTCFVELAIAGGYITIRGGTGIDGSNALTGATDQSTGNLGATILGIAYSYPVTYEVFIGTAPDEVYVVTNYAATCYQQVAWGQSAMPGLVGTGNWYCGVRPLTDSRFDYAGFDSDGETRSSGPEPLVSLFARYEGTGSHQHGVDHKLDSMTWADINAVTDMISLMLRSPSQWNGESVLMPIRVYAARLSGYISPVLECAHARFVNMANLSDGQIVTLGADRWKCYPFFRRSAGLKDYAGSWYAGHAFRYTGP